MGRSLKKGPYVHPKVYAKVEKMNMFENGDSLSSGDYPYWWNWYGWPYWWNYFNGIGRLTWNLTLDPNQTRELGYQWHYFWR